MSLIEIDGETKIIERIILNNNNIIFSVGGGAYCNNQSIQIINSNSRVIYLKASIKTLISRLKGNFSSRPLLRGKKLKDEIIKILNERQKYYDKADYVFEVDNLHINEIVEKIINILNLKKPK